MSGGELLELRLLDTHLLDTFGSKTIARHEIDKLLESSKADSNRRGKYCKLLESGFYLINISCRTKNQHCLFYKIARIFYARQKFIFVCRAERCRSVEMLVQ
jgi:hypothetical protein